jgi:LPS-assembly protein
MRYAENNIGGIASHSNDIVVGEGELASTQTEGASMWVGAKRVALFVGLVIFSATQAHAQLIPADFFNASIDAGAPTTVEASQIIFDSPANTITADGDVVLGQSGYILTGQSLVYNRATGDLRFIGEVVITDPSGNFTKTDALSVTGGMKQAFIESLTIVTYDGAEIAADSMDYDEALRTILERARYAPCGDCIDNKGRRIGWTVNSSRVIYNAEDGSLTLEQPTLAVLGIPVAWLPYLWLPDLSESTVTDLPQPSVDYSEQIGLKVEVPWSVYSSSTTSVLLAPSLLTRQGLLLGGEWVQQFDRGSFQIKASGIYQLDPEAFDFTEAQRRWRGAIQTSGEFVPAENWKVGWSYSEFTDAAYFSDYRVVVGKSRLNQTYATHLNRDTYFDARVQRHNLLGNIPKAAQKEQGIALPNVRLEQRFRLPQGAGQIMVDARMLGVWRETDSFSVRNGVPYTFGYAGRKTHASVEANWRNQWIAGSAVVTPFVGIRADGAHYDGSSIQASAPEAGNMWSATPIAALDVRYPFVAGSADIVHYIEPIAQLVYRGGSTTSPGITNDDSQSVVFEDSNLFSYNRFTGIDRQELGLRANIGGRYVANFSSGSYVEFVAGQSFLLAGTNAFTVSDTSQAAVGSGLETAASYGVVGAYGSFIEGVEFGGKIQVDTTSLAVARSHLGVKYDSENGWSSAFNYNYARAIPAAGVVIDQHEIGAELTLPIAEYWALSGGVYWDLASGTWLQVGGGVTYDDGYVVIGGTAVRTGDTHRSPNDTRVMGTFMLKAPAGFSAGYSGSVPVPSF